MKKLRRFAAIFLVTALLGGGLNISVFAASPEERKFPEEDNTVGGYTTCVGDGPTLYYIDGILIRSRSVTSVYMGWNVEHDSGKTFNGSKFKGWSWTDMSAVSNSTTYPRHYTRVKVSSGDGSSSDSGRKWTTAKRANANTSEVKYTVFATLDSWWGLNDD